MKEKFRENSEFYEIDEIKEFMRNFIKFHKKINYNDLSYHIIHHFYDENYYDISIYEIIMNIDENSEFRFYLDFDRFHKFNEFMNNLKIENFRIHKFYEIKINDYFIINRNKINDIDYIELKSNSMKSNHISIKRFNFENQNELNHFIYDNFIDENEINFKIELNKDYYIEEIDNYDYMII